jgi:hypothetical protein
MLHAARKSSSIVTCSLQSIPAVYGRIRPADNPKPGGHRKLPRPNVSPRPAAGMLLPLTAGLLLWARTRGVHTTHGHLKREPRRVSIGAFPKNSLLCQGNPEKEPCSAHEGARGRVCNAEVAEGEESGSQP